MGLENQSPLLTVSELDDYNQGDEAHIQTHERHGVIGLHSRSPSIQPKRASLKHILQVRIVLALARYK